MLLALILSFDRVADPVAKVAGTTTDKITNLAKTILIVALGLFLITTGAAASALVIGIPLVIVGVSMIAWAAWRMFGNSTPAPGQKPDNTKL